jgi:hypothetical protein
MSNNIDDILALMNKSVEELASDAGLTMEQANFEVIRIGTSQKVVNVIDDLSLSEDFKKLISQTRQH